VDSGADARVPGVETGMEIGGDWVAAETNDAAPDDSPPAADWPAIGEPARWPVPACPVAVRPVPASASRSPDIMASAFSCSFARSALALLR
jgi:hypothetical protein